MDRNLIFALVLSMLVILAFNFYNMKLQQDYLREHPEYREKLIAERQQQVAPDQVGDATPAAVPAFIPLEATPSLETILTSEDYPVTDQVVLVKSPLYQIEIAAQGGRPVSWKLLQYEEILENVTLLENYRKKLANLSPQTLEVQRLRRFLDRKIDWTIETSRIKSNDTQQRTPEGHWHPDYAVEILPTLWEDARALDLNWAGKSLDDTIAYEVEETFVEVNQERELVLRGRTGNLEITKTYTFRPNDYTIDFSVAIRNLSSEPVEFTPAGDPGRHLRLSWQDGIGLDLFNDTWSPPVLFQVSNQIVKEGEIYKRQAKREPTSIDWGLLQNKYFALCIFPEGSITPDVVRSRSQYDHGSLNLVLGINRIRPDETRSENFTLYVGPKDPKHMRLVDQGMADILFMGFFRSMAKPFGLFFLWLLRLIQPVVMNWGLAIILMTILTKAAMYPLMLKQMQTMKNMQRIQPMLKELEQYKENQAKYQKELMALYKREKVNPASGCLPLFLTMPVFVALYLVIYITPELRGAPFFLWINDLSQPDTLFSMYLPGLNWVFRFNLLPFLNGIYSFFSTRKQVVDPKQAPMMQLMPVILIFLFWNFPSGLLLYWFVQGVLGNVQQYVFNRLHDHHAPGRAQAKAGALATQAAPKTKK